MKHIQRMILAAWLVALGVYGLSARSAAPQLEVDEAAVPRTFDLISLDGESVHLGPEGKPVAMVFVDSRCVWCLKRSDEIEESLAFLPAAQHFVVPRDLEQGATLDSLGFYSRGLIAAPVAGMDSGNLGVRSYPTYVLWKDGRLHPLWKGVPNLIQKWAQRLLGVSLGVG